MLVILSPAKTMNMLPDGGIRAISTVPQFEAEAEFLAEKMSRFSVEQLSQTLKISRTLAEENYSRYQHFNDASVRSKQALFAYAGSVFKAISPKDFTDADLAYAQDRIRVVSTLYGLVRPLDAIKAYRIAYTLKLDGIKGNLYDYWHGRLTQPLIADTDKVGGILVNLASLDIQPSLDMGLIREKLTVITPEFKDRKNGKYEVVRTYAKIARGAMARFIIKERIGTGQDLKRFEWNGYRFDESLSDESNYVYIRG